ncbi:MAG: hypothetical protein QG552_242 [Thermodesulfobacteriota bacterium]|nr:hypothetical protein [Thermodesulfobacteriota bacterium]
MLMIRIAKKICLNTAVLGESMAQMTNLLFGQQADKGKYSSAERLFDPFPMPNDEAPPCRWVLHCISAQATLVGVVRVNWLCHLNDRLLRPRLKFS